MSQKVGFEKASGREGARNDGKTGVSIRWHGGSALLALSAPILRHIVSLENKSHSDIETHSHFTQSVPNTVLTK